MLRTLSPSDRLRPVSRSGWTTPYPSFDGCFLGVGPSRRLGAQRAPEAEFVDAPDGPSFSAREERARRPVRSVVSSSDFGAGGGSPRRRRTGGRSACPSRNPSARSTVGLERRTSDWIRVGPATTAPPSVAGTSCAGAATRVAGEPAVARRGPGRGPERSVGAPARGANPVAPFSGSFLRRSRNEGRAATAPVGGARRSEDRAQPGLHDLKIRFTIYAK